MTDTIFYLFKVLLACFGGTLIVQFLATNLIQKITKLDEKRQKTLINIIHSIARYAALVAVLILAISPYLDISEPHGNKFPCFYNFTMLPMKTIQQNRSLHEYSLGF